jgi:hypothetical protein
LLLTIQLLKKMRITLPANLKGKALYQYLVENKADLIARKMMLPIKSDPICCDASFIQPVKAGATKADGTLATDLDPDVFGVKIIGNTAWWCDSHMDVLTDKCYNKSVKERGILIPHINDHQWECTAHVGDVKSVYTQEISLKELGLKKYPGSTTCLAFETMIRKDYNERTHRFYKNGKINQHSIGLQYLSIELAINDPDYEKEIDFWNKYIDKVINREYVEEKGYFWIVTEIKIYEVSCVLFGANELTPTLEIQKSGEAPAHTTTQQQTAKLFDFTPLIN